VRTNALIESRDLVQPRLLPVQTEPRPSGSEHDRRVAMVVLPPKMEGSCLPFAPNVNMATQAWVMKPAIKRLYRDIARNRLAARGSIESSRRAMASVRSCCPTIEYAPPRLYSALTKFGSISVACSNTPIASSVVPS